MKHNKSNVLRRELGVFGATLIGLGSVVGTKLLPYNINLELLSDMRSIPELIMPEKDGVN